MPVKKLLYPLKRKLDGFWRREDPLPTLGYEPRTEQPVASSYTDCAMSPTLFPEFPSPLHGATAPVRPHFRGFKITLWHTIFGRTPLDG